MKAVVEYEGETSRLVLCQCCFDQNTLTKVFVNLRNLSQLCQTRIYHFLFDRALVLYQIEYEQSDRIFDR
jgi:hypothetical protein